MNVNVTDSNTSMTVKTSCASAHWQNQKVWIGDFPPSDWHHPDVPYVPYDQEKILNPWRHPVTLPYWTVTSGTTPYQPWRATQYDDRIELSVDVPGVKLQDLSVVIDSGRVNVVAKRFDSGDVIHHTYEVDRQCESKTATATLDSGVLTIMIKKSSVSVPVKVRVLKK
jgi:HSP20 family molecular chaperone IbpA